MLAAMDRPKPFSMIREFHLADWFTLANAFCGVGSLFSVMSYLQTREVFHLYLACGLIPLAAKQRLLELDEPLMRLQLVDEFLRGKGVVG